MKFTTMSETGVQESGTALAVIVYSIVSVLLLPLVSQITGADSAAGQIIGILVSAVSLFALIRFAVGWLVKRWAAPVLGRWAYASSSGTFAILDLDADGASIRYRVTVYPDLPAITGALDGNPAALQKCTAVADSKALSYRDGVIHLIYSIERTAPGYAPREGVLKLEVVPGGMKGYWHSNVADETSSGTLDIYREKDFRKVHPLPVQSAA